MLAVTLICVGRLKERFFEDACAEYIKRLGAYCKISVAEVPQAALPENPSAALINAALKSEGDKIIKKIPSGAKVVSLCIEGGQYSSEKLAALLSDTASAGISHIVFIIGGSFGLSDEVKALSSLRLSMSEMTFPHRLARVMLLEQIYRGFKINAGGKYHK